MLKYINDSETAVIVLHEIYGLNNHIKGVCEMLYSRGYDVYAPNYMGLEKSFSYDEEEKVYQHFTGEVGFAQACKQILQFISAIRVSYKRVHVIGFSIGATVAWICGGQEKFCDSVVGFYGSRIRDYLEIEPRCPVLLIFPTHETAFCVDELLINLKNKQGVSVAQFSGWHGFADSFSRHYCKDSASQAYDIMLKHIDIVTENS